MAKSPCVEYKYVRYPEDPEWFTIIKIVEEDYVKVPSIEKATEIIKKLEELEMIRKEKL